MQFDLLGELAEEKEEAGFAVGLAEDEAAQPGRDQFEQAGAYFIEVADISVVCKDPATELEGVGIDDREAALGRFADMCEDRFGRDDPGDMMK